MPFVPITIREFTISAEQHPESGLLLVDLKPDTRPADGWTVLPVPLAIPLGLADRLGAALRQQCQRITAQAEQRKREQQERAEALRTRSTAPELSPTYLSEAVAGADRVTEAQRREVRFVPIMVANDLSTNVRQMAAEIQRLRRELADKAELADLIGEEG